MRVILLGFSGSGKGTQGALLERRYGLKKLSLGDYVRACLSRDKHNLRMRLSKPEGNRNWQPLPDDIASELIVSLTATTAQFVLDGFPRSVTQAELAKALVKPDYAVYLACRDATRERRIEIRGRRSDVAEKISTRHAYESSALPRILDALSGTGVAVLTVDSAQSIEAVHAQIVDAIQLVRRDIFDFLGKDSSGLSATLAAPSLYNDGNRLA